METIVICAVFRDAAAGILEWIAFHRLIGVDRFVLYDLGSADGTASLVARSRFGHQVTVIDWARNDGVAAAHADFAAGHAGRFTWAAILGLDEFIHPLDADSIRPLLGHYDGFSAVLLRRLTFVAAGHQAAQGQLVIGSRVSRVSDDSPLNDAASILLRTADLVGAAGVPAGFTLAGEQCNARGEPVPADGLAARACDDVLVVNRYSAPPAAEQHGDARLLAVTTSSQQLHAAHATVSDRRILRFVPRLRAMLHDASLVAQPRTPPPAARAPNQAAAPLLLGIGIITYNRQSILRETLDRVLQHTRHRPAVVAVADDGSTDGTLDMLRARQVLTVTGRNMGVAWNKNRALFLLAELSRCDVVVLLEDDAYPAQDNWEIEWMNAAVRWGHANVAARWIEAHLAPGFGAGTVADPIYSSKLTAQCAVFSREALLFGGYFDTRFREYGHEHVEHSRRLLRLGYGGTEGPVNGLLGPFFKLLWGGIGFHDVAPVATAREAQAERTLELAHELTYDFSYRAPWQNEDEARQLRDEMRHSFPRVML
jgi:hypothetical protein